jgi:hypothetical protein
MISLRRLGDGPIIHSGMLPGEEGNNINGPSLVLVPDWLPNKLGKFYLYFAHHHGQNIRLAYADKLEGPWTVVSSGSLHLRDAKACRDHIASPDVHVDYKRMEILMFFHGVPLNSQIQKTYVARSKDGINFAAGEIPIADFYFRTVRYKDQWIAMSKGGVMYISDSQDGGYRTLSKKIFEMRHPQGNAPGDLRHVALNVSDEKLHVYYSQIGDAPERIYRSSIKLGGAAGSWHAEDKELAIKPWAAWEGANLPPLPSRAGAAHGPENGLRDPAIFLWDNRTFLLYSAAGESSIGIAEILE